MRLRMRSVRNIAQVTRALQAVSGSKVRRAQQAVFATRAYASRAFRVLQHLGQQPGDPSALHPLLTQRDSVNNVGLILITSDRGLCGAYNMNVIRAALVFARQQTAPVKFITVGKKGRDFIHRRRLPVIGEFTPIPNNPTFVDVSAIGRLAVDEFLSGRLDAVYVAYTDYINALRLEPKVRPLLPLKPEEAKSEHMQAASSGPAAVYLYEPSQEALLDVIIPRFTQLQVYQSLLESLASEHSARMTAMSNATENAKDLLGSLQLTYNKSRQLSITSDLLDIVGGVEALAKATEE